MTEMPSLEDTPHPPGLCDCRFCLAGDPPSPSDDLAMIQIELASAVGALSRLRPRMAASRNPAERRAKAHLTDAMGRVVSALACLEEAQELIERGTP